MQRVKGAQEGGGAKDGGRRRDARGKQRQEKNGMHEAAWGRAELYVARRQWRGGAEVCGDLECGVWVGLWGSYGA